MNDQREIDLVAASARMKVPWHTAHRYVLTGVLKGTRRNGRWWVDLDDLKRFLRDRVEREQEAPSDGD